MNLPNKLSILRIALVPLMVIFMLWQDFTFNYLVAGLIFGIASFTDMLDGRIARKYNMITDFGKFADPLADKILVISALVCFVELGLFSSTAVIITLFREFAVTSVRLVAVENGKVIAANIWGKVKTVSQMVAISVTFLLSFVLKLMTDGYIPVIGSMEAMNMAVYILNNILIWFSVIMTVVSGIIYIRDNFEFIKNAK